jgi:hypothetical protein
MKNWTDWEIIRRRVSVAGRVFGRDGTVAAGVGVSITSMPEAYRRRLDGALGASATRQGDPPKRLDLVVSGPDGVYYYLDLPQGRYTLTAVDSRTGGRDEKSVTVKGEDSGGGAPVIVDFDLSGSAGSPG